MTSDLIFRLDPAGRCVFAGVTSAGDPHPSLPEINAPITAWAKSPEAIAQWTDAVEHLVTTGETRDVLTTLPVGTQERTYQAYLTPERQGETVASIFVVLRDITEILQREQTLVRENAALNETLSITQQQNLRSVGLGADLGHELRAPLTNIISLLDLLATSALDSVQLEWVTAARSSARALLKLTNDVLELAFIEARRIRFEPAPLSLADLVRDVVVLFARRTQEKNLDLIVRIDPSLPPTLVGDAGRIRQVLSNLLDNALKFTTQGYVLIDTARWEETPQRVMLQIEVEDSGTGVPPDRRERIFERFAQATIGANSGSGLGLAISRQLALLMDGSLTYVSRPGTGAVFQFCVPLEQEGEKGRGGEGETGVGRPALGVNPQSQTSTPNAQRLTPTPSVLIVDGSYLRQCVLYEMVTAWGMNAEVRQTTAELRLVLERPRHPFDFVLLDEGIWHALQQEAPMTIAKMPRFVLLSSPLNETEPPGETGIPLSAVVSKPTFAQTLGETLLSLTEEKKGRQEEEKTETDATHFGAEESKTEQEEKAQQSEPFPSSLLPLSPSVLIVEDDPISRQITAVMVRRAGYAVWEAANEVEALELAEEQNFRLILLDARLPESQPVVLLAELRRRGDAEMRIAFLTAYTQDELPEAVKQAGADRILTKPLVMEELARLMSDTTLQPQTQAQEAETVQEDAAESPVLNRDLLWERVGRVPSILRSLVELVKAQFPPLLAEMRAHLQNNAVPEFLRAAHQARGMMMSVYADAAVAAVRQYEQATRDNNSAALRSADAALDTEWLRLQAALDRLIAETADEAALS